MYKNDMTTKKVHTFQIQASRNYFFEFLSQDLWYRGISALLLLFCYNGYVTHPFFSSLSASETELPKEQNP